MQRTANMPLDVWMADAAPFEVSRLVTNALGELVVLYRDPANPGEELRRCETGNCEPDIYSDYRHRARWSDGSRVTWEQADPKTDDGLVLHNVIARNNLTTEWVGYAAHHAKYGPNGTAWRSAK
jgi:hypothetical protein